MNSETTLESLKLWKMGNSSVSMLDPSRVVVPESEVAYKLAWEVVYRSGQVRRQFERASGVLVQSLWGKISHDGIANINIHDSMAYGMPRVAVVHLPEGAEGVIYYECDFQMVAGLTRRVYCFGWRLDGEFAYLAKIDPEHRPFKVEEFDFIV